MLGLKPFSCEQLRDYLEKKEDEDGATLLLDCRSFLSFNDCHISSAVNAYCPSILRRRSRGKLPLHVLIPSAEVRDKLARGYYAVLVLYEENSSGAREIEDLSALRVVNRCLLQQQQEGMVARSSYYLEGGLQRFRQKYPHLCVGHPCRNVLPANGVVMPLSSSPSASKLTSSSAAVQFQQPNSGNPIYERGDPVEILPHLYLGSAFHAANQSALRRLGVTALLNVSRTSPNLTDGQFVYKSIPVDDSGSADISSWFAEAIQFIDDVAASEGKVLVHCHAGISRSATICLAYLMRSKHLRLEEAYEYVKRRRSIISPNFNFMGQLLKYEAQLFSPLSGFAVVVAAKATESCLRSAQRFVFDLAVVDDGYPRISSPGPLLSPLCANVTPIMSPS